MRKLIVSTILIMMSYCVMSQQTTDLGIQIAAATYWGDIENVSYSKSITPVIGILGRWNFNQRTAIRGQLLTGNLQAEGFFSNANIGQYGTGVDTPLPAPSTSFIILYPKDPVGAYTFKRSFQSVEVLFEFNFRDYKLGSTKKATYTPFVAVGVGGLISRSSRLGSVILQPLEYSTGFYEAYVDADLKKTNNLDILSLTIPVGGGIKFNLTKRLGGIVEVIVRKTFSDNIDNLDDPKRFQFDPATIAPTFVYPDKVAKTQLNNNDWYATLAVSLCYQLWSSKGNCQIYDKIKK